MLVEDNPSNGEGGGGIRNIPIKIEATSGYSPGFLMTQMEKELGKILKSKDYYNWSDCPESELDVLMKIVEFKTWM